MNPLRSARIIPRAASLGAILALAACASPYKGRTSLSDLSAKFESVKESRVDVKWGDGGDGKPMRATLVNNEPIAPLHNAGYSGLMEIHVGDGPSPFTPLYAGLNLEHVLNGQASQDKDIQFEPRRHPMEIRKISDTVYELYQAPLPNIGLESCTRFEFKPPNIIDVTFECIPRKENFPYGYLNVFWASYIMKPKNPEIWFRGRKKGWKKEEWVKGLSPSHGELATHRGATDTRDYNYERPFPLTLVFNESEFEYVVPMYYGRYKGADKKEYIWSVMFDADDKVRFTQSPTGGGEGNPAWDFQWFIDHPKVGKLYRLCYRAAYKPWGGQPNDLITEYEAYRHGR